MTAYDTILARRSIRKFTPAPIPDDAIDTLLNSAMAAPSACNMRPWLFYVVKNPELRDKLRGVSKYSDMNSSLIIIVAGDEKRSLNHRVNDFWIQDCAAATQNILLAATELGIGSCWCGLFPMVSPVKRTREILELDESVIPLALIHLGYPDENPEPRTQYDEKRVRVYM